MSVTISSVRPTRPNDYYYDPSNISSGPKDYFRQGRLSKITMTKFAICPVFPSMFSDLQNYPRKQYVIRRQAPIPQYVDKTHDTSSVSRSSRQQVLGSDRYKYFHVSPQQSSTPAPVPKIDLSCFYEVDTIKKANENRARFKKKNTKNASMQTAFREASIQTSPWEPNYKVIQGDPELLMLDFLKWGQNLPAGTAEVDMITRMRTKRKWECSFPAGTSAKDFALKRHMIEELNRVEWANRERDIEEIQSLRLELLEKMLNEIHVKSKCRSEKKLRLWVDMKLQEKREKIIRIQKDAEREKRRLKFQYTGILTKYGKVNVFDEHADYKSELYCPLMRNGTNPKYAHETLHKSAKNYKAQFYKVEDYCTIPKNLKDGPNVDNVKLEGRRLCIRETKWTLPVLKSLYEELKELRITQVQHPNLRVCIQHIASLPPTPEIEQTPNMDDAINKAATLLQKILRGRAAQNKIFVGRERCHELIDELRGNYALLKGEICKKALLRKKRKEEQINAFHCLSNMNALEGSLKKLGGSVAGTLFDFLNKDLQRLLRERRAHAMILLVERLRQIREAEEAGRRQKEIRRRKEHDEMFKQIVKVQQDTVDLYLQDIITEGMEFTSEETANEYVIKLAAKIESEQEELEKVEVQMDREEYIAAMVHNFVIPEVEKTIIRDRMSKQRVKFLRTAHDTIYNTMEVLPKPEESSTSSEIFMSESMIAPSPSTADSEGPRRAVERIKAAEKKLVEQDVKAILEELVTVPYKQSVLKGLLPCGGKQEYFEEELKMVPHEEEVEEVEEEQEEASEEDFIDIPIIIDEIEVPIEAKEVIEDEESLDVQVDVDEEEKQGDKFEEEDEEDEETLNYIKDIDKF